MTGPALLRTIIANPQDDAPRLVYADWLQENGQTERADFIETQLALAQLPKPGRAMRVVFHTAPDPNTSMHMLSVCEACPPGGQCGYHILAGRAGKLLTAHGRRWVPREAPPMTMPNLELGPESYIQPPDVILPRGWHNEASEHYRFARGFIESVTLPSAAWLAHGDALSWSPEQTVPCPTCKGSQYVRAKPCRTCCPDGESKALVGPSTVPRPMPPTAQPIVEVRLTTRLDPHMIGGLSVAVGVGPPDVIDWLDDPTPVLRLRWPAVETWHLPPEPWVDEHPRDDRGRWTADDDWLSESRTPPVAARP